MKTNRDIDIVVYGATGFTGRLVAEYLNQTYGVDGDVKWAMAGRSIDKLVAVRDELGIAKNVSLLVANADDLDSINNMVNKFISKIN